MMLRGMRIALEQIAGLPNSKRVLEVMQSRSSNVSDVTVLNDGAGTGRYLSSE
jgi:hypothetical protein